MRRNLTVIIITKIKNNHNHNDDNNNDDNNNNNVNEGDPRSNVHYLGSSENKA